MASFSIMTDKIRWIARLTPKAGKTIRDLLKTTAALDVWERKADSLVVMASEDQLRELERRHLANVEWLSTATEYEARFRERLKQK